MTEKRSDTIYHKINQLDTWNDKKILIIESKQIEQIKSAIPTLALLDAVRTAEKKIADQRLQMGISLLGVENNGDLNEYTLRTQLGGSFEHILEHGLCSILDQHCSINEQASGLTDWDRRGETNQENDDIVIYIAPPPSMLRDQAVQIIEKSLIAIQKQYKESKKIDLLELKLN